MMLSNYIVYCVTFPNSKMYIGITSRTMEERKKEHYKNCRNYAISSALKKYKNQENWKVLFENLTKDEAVKKEKSLISLWETKAPYGYNLTNGGDGTEGHTISIESKIKMYDSKLIECFKVTGEFVGEYMFQIECATKLGVLQSKVYQCLTGKCSQTRGYKFRYKGEEFKYSPRKPGKPRPKGYKHSDEARKKMSEAGFKRESLKRGEK